MFKSVQDISKSVKNIFKNGFRGIIRKKMLINGLKSPKYRNNKIVLSTLKVIKNKQFKVKPIAKQHRYFTRKKMEYTCGVAWQITPQLILFNERYRFKNMNEILEACVHEVNHCLNAESFKYDIAYMMKSEVIAYVAEYFFNNNCIKISKKQFQIIKDECFTDYRKLYEKNMLVNVFITLLIIIY